MTKQTFGCRTIGQKKWKTNHVLGRSWGYLFIANKIIILKNIDTFFKRSIFEFSLKQIINYI